MSGNQKLTLKGFSELSKGDLNKLIHSADDKRIKNVVGLINEVQNEEDAILYLKGMDKIIKTSMYNRFIKFGIVDEMSMLINKYPTKEVNNIFITNLYNIVMIRDEDSTKFVLFTKDIIPNLVNLYLSENLNQVETMTLINTITELSLAAASAQASEEIKYMIESPLLPTAISRLSLYDLRMQFNTLRMLYTIHFLPSKTSSERLMIKHGLVPKVKELIENALHKLDDEEQLTDKQYWVDVYGLISVGITHIISILIEDVKIPKEQSIPRNGISNVGLFRDILKFVRIEIDKLKANKKLDTQNGDRRIKLLGILKLNLGLANSLKKDIQNYAAEDLMKLAEEEIFDEYFDDEGIFTCIRELSNFHEEEEYYLTKGDSKIDATECGKRAMLTGEHAENVENWIKKSIWSQNTTQEGKKLVDPENVLNLTFIILGMASHWSKEEKYVNSFYNIALLLPGLLKECQGMPRIVLFLLKAMKYAFIRDERLKNHFSPDVEWAYVTFKKQKFLGEMAAEVLRKMKIYKADDPVFKFGVIFIFSVLIFIVLSIVFAIKYRAYLLMKISSFLTTLKAKKIIKTTGIK